MTEFLMLMKGTDSQGDWDGYIEKLVATGRFRGGSSLGRGRSCSQAGETSAESGVTGFMRFEADTIEEVRELLAGNPVFEAGGVVEIHELVRD